MDDNSASFGSAVPLSGITTIAAGESVIFMETNDLAGKTAAFLSNWFGANPPAGLQIGSYTGGSVGLGTGGDAVNLYDGGGLLQASVTFGASPTGTFRTFNNAAGANNATISELSAVGVNGAFVAANSATEIGSPGTIGKLFISEVAPWASGNSPVGADWFEVTNTTAHAVDITGWKMDDNSNSFAAAVVLNGITSIAPGESVIFIETNDLPAKAAAFLSNWFGTTPPTSLQIGSYTGGSVGLSATADAVNLFNSAGQIKVSVTFGASPTGPTFATFENAAALNNGAVSRLSAAGVNGAFVAVNDANEIGSPGTINNDPPAAGADSVTISEDTAVTFNVLTNDTDANGDTLTITGHTAVNHGVLVSNGNGSFTYTPAANFNGADSFTYTITDGKGRTATASVGITVSAVNDAPTLAVPAAQTTVEDVAVNISGITVADVDAGEGTGAIKVTLSVGSGTLTIATGVAGGLTATQMTGNGTGTVVLRGPIAAVNATLAAGAAYLGNLNFSGTDTLTIVADDLGNTGAGGALTDSKTVRIRVESSADQIAALQASIATLYAQSAVNQGQANSLFKKLENAQTALAQNKLKVAYNLIGAFSGEVQSLLATGVLTPAQADPLLSEVESLLKSLLTGGGF
jgi:VCBS repeat-containing protein